MDKHKAERGKWVVATRSNAAINEGQVFRLTEYDTTRTVDGKEESIWYTDKEYKSNRGGFGKVILSQVEPADSGQIKNELIKRLMETGLKAGDQVMPLRAYPQKSRWYEFHEDNFVYSAVGDYLVHLCKEFGNSNVLYEQGKMISQSRIKPNLVPDEHPYFTGAKRKVREAGIKEGDTLKAQCFHKNGDGQYYKGSFIFKESDLSYHHSKGALIQNVDQYRYIVLQNGRMAEKSPRRSQNNSDSVMHGSDWHERQMAERIHIDKQMAEEMAHYAGHQLILKNPVSNLVVRDPLKREHPLTPDECFPKKQLEGKMVLDIPKPVGTSTDLTIKKERKLKLNIK